MKDILYAAMVFVAFIGVAMWLDARSCGAQWSSSGMAHSWGPIQGCMIQRADKTWIPDKAYREVTR